MPHVKKSVIDEDEIDTVLDSDIVFSGSLESAKSLLVKGKVSGTITCGDDLYLSGESSVDADISAVRVIVRGALKGRVKASESIQILSGSAVEAALEAPDIVIEDEEHFKGTVTIAENPGNA